MRARKRACPLLSLIHICTMKAVAEKVGEWVGQQDAALREA